jgi:predicted DNA-binding transcriptional regulator AlpA
MSRRKQPKRRRPAPLSEEVDCYSIPEFCRRTGISRPHYYRLREDGLTPVEFRLGTRVLITKEAAEAWRRERSQPRKRSNNPSAAVATAP